MRLHARVDRALHVHGLRLAGHFLRHGHPRQIAKQLADRARLALFDLGARDERADAARLSAIERPHLTARRVGDDDALRGAFAPTRP